MNSIFTEVRSPLFIYSVRPKVARDIERFLYTVASAEARLVPGKVKRVTGLIH